MVSNIPASSDDIIMQKYNKIHMINPHTLWFKINECENCKHFKVMAMKSLKVEDLNFLGQFKTLFVPINDNSYNNPLTYVSSLTVPGQLFINQDPINIKVQNELKEYISIDKKFNEPALIHVLDQTWVVVRTNIICSNGILHFMERMNLN